eukprot:scaffold154380_cov14-Tisochrysis_lutea.AAC.1
MGGGGAFFELGNKVPITKHAPPLSQQKLLSMLNARVIQSKDPSSALMRARRWSFASSNQPWVTQEQCSTLVCRMLPSTFMQTLCLDLAITASFAGVEPAT